jgi:DNA-binding transcriptional ArsR family regulator
MEPVVATGGNQRQIGLSRKGRKQAKTVAVGCYRAYSVVITPQCPLGCSFVSEERCDLLCLDLEIAEAVRKRRLGPEAAEGAAGRARAFADPTRLMLAAALGETGELCVCDLAWIAERSQNLVSHHLRALRAAGLVRSRRDGKMVMYALTAAGEVLLRSVLDDRIEVAG